MISPNPDFADSESGAVAREKREKAADKVREENLELHRRLNLTPSMLSVIEPDGRYTWVNDVVLQYFGVSAADMTSDDLRRRVVHPDDFQRVREERQGALASGVPFEYENRLRRHDGQFRWFLIRYQPLKDAAGRVVRWYGSATDIEDRKQSEEALRRSEAYLAEAQSLSHTGSWAYNPSTGETVHWSEEQFRLHGFDPERGIPSFGEIVERVHPEDRTLISEAVKSVSRGKDFDFHYRVVLPNGTTRYLYSTAHPVFNSSGDRAEFMGVVMDITERKRAEEARLEERVRERTRIARELHDTLLQSFQAPLLFFQAAINLLQERPDEARKILERALDQAQQAVTEGRDAIQDLRAETAVSDLAVAIRALGEELAANETNRSSAVFDVVVVGTVREVHPVLCEEACRIVREALRNAFQHARAQQIQVEIRYDEEHFGVRVRDDGKGIDPKFLGGDGRREGHYGLQGMRERAKLVGGQLTILNGLVSGTEIELSIPASTAYVSTGSA